MGQTLLERYVIVSKSLPTPETTKSAGVPPDQLLRQNGRER